MNISPKATTPQAVEVADSYFDAWRRNAPIAMSDVLAPDVRVNGPLGLIEGAERYQHSLARIFDLTRDLVVAKRWVDGGDVLTWFDLHPHGDGDPFPVASWLHIDHGRITRVRVTFDLGQLLAAGDPRRPSNPAGGR